MSCKIIIRACPNPNNFFDEIIPQDGLELKEWKLKIHREQTIFTAEDGNEIDAEVRWLHAETNCELEHLNSTLKNKKPQLIQYLNALTGFRKIGLVDDVKFTMWFENYVHQGILHNIEPLRADFSVGIQNIQTRDSNGNVIFDERTAAKDRIIEQARRRIEAAKNDVKDISKYVKFIDDPYFCRAWESYNLAVAKHDHAINHVYDIRDAAKKRIGNAKKLLNISNDDWRNFGKILNDQSVKGGRHNGNHPTPMKSLTKEERTFILKFSEKLLRAFGEFLESEEKNKQEN